MKVLFFKFHLINLLFISTFVLSNNTICSLCHWQNGKLDLLNSLLSGQDMYKPDFYHEDPWVEFIQLDLDDPAEKNESSDTQHLLGLSRSGSSHVLNFKSDEDSGRASCYDSEIPNSEDLASLLPGHSGRGDNHPLVSRSSSSIPDHGVQQTSEVEETPIQTQPAVPSWVNMEFYAQVSDFTPAGGVVLSPGQLNSSPEKKKEEEHKKKIQFQLVSDGAYTSENTARQLSADVPPSPGPEQGYQTFPTQAVEGNLWNGGEYLVSTSDSQMPYLLPEAPPAPILSPVSDYTVVQEVNAQHSLLLNPPSSQPAICPHSPNKNLPAMPIMPMGYLTPDLLGNLTPWRDWKVQCSWSCCTFSLLETKVAWIARHGWKFCTFIFSAVRYKMKEAQNVYFLSAAAVVLR